MRLTQCGRQTIQPPLPHRPPRAHLETPPAPLVPHQAHRPPERRQMHPHRHIGDLGPPRSTTATPRRPRVPGTHVRRQQHTVCVVHAEYLHVAGPTDQLADPHRVLLRPEPLGLDVRQPQFCRPPHRLSRTHSPLILEEPVTLERSYRQERASRGIHQDRYLVAIPALRV